MKAFHGEQSIKEKYLNRVKAHYSADEIVKGRYWEHGKGCAVGCTIHSSKHKAYEDELGIPMILARLEEFIFENLPNEKAKEWPINFLEAIPVGKKLDKVWPKFAIWLLTDPDHGALQFAETEKQKKVIRAVSEAYQNVLDNPNKEIDWAELRAAAATAVEAADAADAAAYIAYVADAADVYAAVCASASASAAYVAYGVDSREGHCIAQSEKLLELLRHA